MVEKCNKKCSIFEITFILYERVFYIIIELRVNEFFRFIEKVLLNGFVKIIKQVLVIANSKGVMKLDSSSGIIRKALPIHLYHNQN